MTRRWVCLSDEEINDLRDIVESYHIRHTDLGFPISQKGLVSIYKFNKVQQKIKISSAKGKGRNLQKWVCERISEITNIPYNQQDDQCLIHAREMGQAGIDVILRGKALEMVPFAIECKSTEGLNLTGAVNQAKANNNGYCWLLVHRRKSLPETITIMDFSTFEWLLGFYIKHFKKERNSS